MKKYLISLILCSLPLFSQAQSLVWSDQTNMFVGTSVARTNLFTGDSTNPICYNNIIISNRMTIGNVSRTNWPTSLITDTISLVVQDPTNSLAYWMANPYPTSTVTEVTVKSQGMTGAVDIVWQDWNSTWYTTNTIHNSIIATNSGVLLASFANSGVLTNRTRVGFVATGLSTFAITNMLSVDFKLSVP